MIPSTTWVLLQPLSSKHHALLFTLSITQLYIDGLSVSKTTSFLAQSTPRASHFEHIHQVPVGSFHTIKATYSCYPGTNNLRLQSAFIAFHSTGFKAPSLLSTSSPVPIDSHLSFHRFPLLLNPMSQYPSVVLYSSVDLDLKYQLSLPYQHLQSVQLYPLFISGSFSSQPSPPPQGFLSRIHYPQSI